MVNRSVVVNVKNDYNWKENIKGNSRKVFMKICMFLSFMALTFGIVLVFFRVFLSHYIYDHI